MYERNGGSFRDPKGYVLHHNKNVYRVINTSYQEEYDYCIKSGLYKKLIDEGLLLSFEESLDLEINSKDVYKIVKQERINFISYPYEWSFDMIKDAAITTLKIQEISKNCQNAIFPVLKTIFWSAEISGMARSKHF